MLFKHAACGACIVRKQVLERYPRGLGDLNTRRVMWQLLKAVDYVHANKARERAALLSSGFYAFQGLLLADM